MFLWNWIQKYKPTKENTTKEEKEDIEEFIVDETLLKVSNQFVWFGLLLLIQ